MEPMVKLCECGMCGLPAPIAKRTDNRRGWIKGQPVRFINSGHARRKDCTRFWESVDRSNSNGCHLWTGGRNLGGYGQTHVDGRQVGAHRVAWMLTHGEPPRVSWRARYVRTAMPTGAA
jgi:hypothetical protein